MASLSDIQLWHAWRDGGRDPEVFSTLLARCSGNLMLHCMNLTRHRDAGFDLFQDTIVQLLMRAPAISDNVFGYVHCMATHIWRNQQRRDGRKKSQRDRADQALGAPVAEYDDCRERHELLAQGLACLDPKTRACVELRFAHGETLNTIGTRVGMTPAGCQRSASRGLGALKRFFQIHGFSR